jgi:hypothetical protein
MKRVKVARSRVRKNLGEAKSQKPSVEIRPKNVTEVFAQVLTAARRWRGKIEVT